MTDEDFMALALVQAREAAALGEVPVGAVIVRDGVVIAAGRNAPISRHDPTAHAEIAALRAAAIAVGNYRLDECELFVTLEPCAMCSGAMLAARLKRVVFGAVEPKTGAAGSVIDLFANRQLNHQTVLRGGVSAEACSALMKDFFRQRRAEQSGSASGRHPLRDDALRTPDSAFADLADYPWKANYLGDLPALDGLRMHYLDEPPDAMALLGEPCRTYFCLHDGPAWSYAFRMLIPALLRAGHRVVAPDLIGFGKSDKPKKESFHAFSRHRQILIELVEKLDLQNIVLVMPGQGGLLGLSLPMSAPQRYQGLRLVNLAAPLEGNDLPMSQGQRILQARRGKDSGSSTAGLADSFAAPQSLESRAIYEFPFPNAGYQAALRAFRAGGLDFDNTHDVRLETDVEIFWCSCQIARTERPGHQPMGYLQP